MPVSVSCLTFSHSAPAHIWRGVQELFVESFLSAPYFEDVTGLSTILEWGPGHLGQGRGRLVVAKRGELLAGFALGNALSGDSSWQLILSRLSESSEEAAWALANQEEALIVHELAARRSERGSGIASICMTALLESRPESQTPSVSSSSAKPQTPHYGHRSPLWSAEPRPFGACCHLPTITHRPKSKRCRGRFQ